MSFHVVTKPGSFLTNGVGVGGVGLSGKIDKGHAVAKGYGVRRLSRGGDTADSALNTL